MINHRSIHWLSKPLGLKLILAFCLVNITPHLTADEDVTSSRELGIDFLQSGASISSPLNTLEYTPPEYIVRPSNKLEGILSLTTEGAQSQLEILTDTFDIASNASLELNRLPPFSISFVTDGTDLIPLQREPQRSDHPNWELIVQPGKTWDEATDNGWSRASFPFSLKEKNENCIHNGLMTFLYKSDGSSSRAVWQVTSETCLYVKINLWGFNNTTYQPMPLSTSAEAVEKYRQEVSHRLPVSPITKLAGDYPEINLAELRPAGFKDASVFGLLIDGVHYRSHCLTRFGPYPYCEALILPSYSLAKSIFAGLAFQLLVSRWPEFAAIPISELIPECKLADERWDDVLPGHLLDMTTGNYESQTLDSDENAARMLTFFEAEDHRDKLRFSCEAWPRKSVPGSSWAYHTTDTYLLGVAMNMFLKQKLGPESDIYNDLLYPETFWQLNLSPSLRWTQRTYDETAQPFTGYGLVMLADDIIRLAHTLSSGKSTDHNLASVHSNRYVLLSDHDGKPIQGAHNTAYMNGFWAVEASQWMPCEAETWIPFMSGYGGIAVVMFPGGGIYYYFTDSGKHGFRRAAIEANKVLNYCKE